MSKDDGHVADIVKSPDDVWAAILSGPLNDSVHMECGQTGPQWPQLPTTITKATLRNPILMIDAFGTLMPIHRPTIWPFVL